MPRGTRKRLSRIDAKRGPTDRRHINKYATYVFASCCQGRKNRGEMRRERHSQRTIKNWRKKKGQTGNFSVRRITINLGEKQWRSISFTSRPWSAQQTRRFSVASSHEITNEMSRSADDERQLPFFPHLFSRRTGLGDMKKEWTVREREGKELKEQKLSWADYLN